MASLFENTTLQHLIYKMTLSARYCMNFKFIFFMITLERFFSIVNIRNECLFMGAWGMNLSAEIKKNHPRICSWYWFVPRYDSLPMQTEKKTLIPKIKQYGLQMVSQWSDIIMSLQVSGIAPAHWAAHVQPMGRFDKELALIVDSFYQQGYPLFQL